MTMILIGGGKNKMKKLHQVELQRHLGGCRYQTLICYVPTEPSHKVGDQITLSDSEKPKEIWTVKWISDKVVYSSDINRGWNNNI